MLAAIASYEHWARDEFHAAHDHFRLLGEDNFRRYLPVEPLRIRVHPERHAERHLLPRRGRPRGRLPGDDQLAAVACRASGRMLSNCSIDSPIPGPARSNSSRRTTRRWPKRFAPGQVARVRYAAPDRVPEAIRAAAAEALQYVADTPVSLHGRVELLWYLREQSISHVYHRYGNLGLRIGELRDEPA